jgi:hypothetical protein
MNRIQADNCTVVDALSLKLIYIQLKEFNASEGPVTGIVLGRQVLDKSVEFANSPTRFGTFREFETFFKKMDNLVDFERNNTKFVGLYSLKSFNVRNRKKGGLFNIANNNGKSFKANGPAAKILINSLNTKYIKIYGTVHNLFNKLKMDEYILTSNAKIAGGLDEYIQYGYIERYFSKAMDDLKTLYRKYNK